MVEEEECQMNLILQFLLLVILDMCLVLENSIYLSMFFSYFFD